MAEPLQLWERLAPVLLHKTEEVEIKIAGDLTEQEQGRTHDAQEEYKDTLRLPGLWLNEPMSRQETKECIDLYHTAKNIDGGTPADSGDDLSNVINESLIPSDQREALLTRTRQCMNSLIHLYYLAKKDEDGLEAAEGAILYKDDKSEKELDIYPAAIKHLEMLAFFKNGLTKFFEATLTSEIANEVITEDAIRQPGLWLEEPLTDAEVEDIDKMQEELQELAKGSEKDIDEIINVASPYLNSLMHMIYLLFKDYFHVKAVEDGVIYHKAPNDENLYFDIVAYTVDFALDNFFMFEDKAADSEEFYNSDDIPNRPTFKQPRQIKDRIERVKSYVDKKAENNIISTLQAIIPKYHVIPNNSIMNALTSNLIINAGAFDLPVINKKGRRKEVTTYTIASCAMLKDKDGNLILSKLTEYERQVSDAIMSIWEEALKNNLPAEFTADMVFQSMPGSGEQPSPQQRGAITKAIEKLRSLKLTLDVTEELRTRGIISNDEQRIYDDYYLSAGRETRRIKNGGQIIQTYILHSEPIVLSYCKLTDQLITTTPKWLEVKKIKKGKIDTQPLTMNQERQAITGYLIRRIKVMQHDNEVALNKKKYYDAKRAKEPDKYPPKAIEDFRTRSAVILFSTIFETIGKPTPTRDKAHDIRKFCFDVLDYYTKAELIPGYTQQKKGRAITGIEIML